MTLLPRDQRTLLKMERSLRKDPRVKAMLETFTCHCGLAGWAAGHG